jgi:acetylornithine deacetylase
MEDYGQKVLTRRTHPLLGHPSLHASLIQGGRELSTYPDHCMLSLEIRILPGETLRMYEDDIQKIMASVACLDPDFDAEAEVTFFRPPMEAEESEPIVQSVMAGASRALGHTPNLAGMSGWLDSAILQEAGIPTVIYGPVGSGYHGMHEYTDLESVVQVAQGLYATAKDFLKGESR